MIPNYAFIGILMIGAIGFALAPLILVAIVAPRKRSRPKGDTYECGVLPTGETWVRFRIQYYIFALLFVVFDIETVFIYPWAVAYGGLAMIGAGTFALVAMIIFLVMLVDALVYAWSKGDLRWV